MDAKTLQISDIRDFVEKQRKSGNYKENTAQNFSASLSIISSIVDPETPVTEIRERLDEHLQRYHNLNPQVSASSLASYRARIRRVLSDFENARTKVGWRPAQRPVSAPTAVRKEERRAERSDIDVKESKEAITHRLPLRSDFDVELLLPRDLSAGEAGRLARWIENLAAFSFSGKEGS